MAVDRGADLRTLGDLTERQFGRRVIFAGYTGTLQGLIPCRDRVQALLLTGGVRLYTDALPADTCVEVVRGSA